MKKIKHMIGLAVLFVAAGLLTAAPVSAQEKDTINFGNTTGSLDNYAFIEDSIRAALEEAGYSLEETTFSDGVQPNTALAEGSSDINFFQHLQYLEAYNESNGTDLVIVEPYAYYAKFAMYSDKFESVEDITDGATVALSNDPSNQDRALQFLQELGLVTLVEGVEIATVLDIEDNPKNLTFTEAGNAALPTSLADVDVVVTSATHFYRAGLDANDYIEVANDGPDFSVGFAVRAEDADAEWVQILIQAAFTQEFYDYLSEPGIYGVQFELDEEGKAVPATLEADTETSAESEDESADE